MMMMMVTIIFMRSNRRFIPAVSKICKIITIVLITSMDAEQTMNG